MRAVKSAINRLGARLGVKLVSADWGPRGFEAAFARAKADGFVPGSVIDVGASTGIWTGQCREFFPDARYFLIDPLPRNEPRLAALAANDPKIDYWAGALGAQAGTTGFFDHGDQSSALPSSSFPGTQIDVPMQTLDAVLAGRDLPAPLLIKVDVQGFEMQVLRGATETLARTGMLLVEVNFLEPYEGGALAHEVIALLGGHGFRIVDICTYAQRPRDGRLAQSDMIFARPEALNFDTKGWS